MVIALWAPGRAAVDTYTGSAGDQGAEHPATVKVKEELTKPGPC